MSILSAVACEVKAQEYVQRFIAYCNICHDHIVTHVGWGPVGLDDVRSLEIEYSDWEPLERF